MARDKLKKKIATYHEGVSVRKHEVEQARVAMAKDEAELSKLQNEEKILKRLVEQLKGIVLSCHVLFLRHHHHHPQVFRLAGYLFVVLFSQNSLCCTYKINRYILYILKTIFSIKGI